MGAITTSIEQLEKQAPSAKQWVSRRSICGEDPSILTDIYQEDINIAIWQRQLSSSLTKAAGKVLNTDPGLQISASITPGNAFDTINGVLNSCPGLLALSQDITELVEMFCCLFDLNRVGLRLTALDRAMCPRFHVDKVPCRLVTTYWGRASQWLPHPLVDHSKLGQGNQGKTDEASGLFSTAADIEQLNQGDVALLKGERWQGNEGAGLVHRSPQLETNAQRLLLTLDFIDG